MNKYEITTITREDTKEKEMRAVKKDIETLGGKILSVNSLGQRQCVYAIKKETAGFYTVIGFEIEPTKVLELNQKLALSPEILRHIILVAKAVKIEVPKKPSFASSDAKTMEDEKATEGKKAEKPKVEEIAEKPKPKKAAQKIVAPKPITPVAPKVTKEVAKIEEEESSTEDRLKALDKKLDELLKE